VNALQLHSLTASADDPSAIAEDVMGIAKHRLSRRSVVAGALALGAAGAAESLRLAPARAAAPPLGTQAPAWYRFKLGDHECTVVSDGPLALGEPSRVFTGVPKEELDTLLVDNFLQPNAIAAEQNALVLNTGRQLVLFDTGLGASRLFGPTTGRLIANLKAAGIDPSSIDAVCLTHAHPDHCWALVGEGGRPNFPNARVFVSKADFDFWTDEAKLQAPGVVKDLVAGTRPQLLPLRERITFVENGKETVSGVTAMASPGHTVGHHHYVIASGRDTLVLTGDLAHHHVLSLQRPRIAFAFDTDPRQAAESRARTFDMAARERTLLLVYHFPFPGLGHLAKAGEGYAWHPAPLRTAL
jgi:glyoxylase-like metal-dependent hydrolase (beta-lactamase superfamily II)